MWTVTRPDQTVLPTAQSEGNVVTAPLVRELVRNLASDTRASWPTHLLDQEVELHETTGGLPGRDAVEIWSARVERPLFESPSFLIRRQGQMLAVEDEYGTLTLGHERTIVVFPAEETVKISYQAEASDTSPDFFLFEWRLYAGESTGIREGFQRMLQSFSAAAGKAWRFAEIKCGKVSGFVVGTILRVSGRISPQPLKHDPSWRIRLSHSLKAGGELYPSITDVGHCGEITVLVHGTISTCYDAFRCLMQRGLARTVARFEHDTFISILDNARELAEDAGATGATEITFIAHSRGGLVARLAAHQLLEDDSRPAKRVKILAFGTPHLGTPLVGQTVGVLRSLAAVGAPFVGGIPVMDPTAAFIGYVFAKFDELPIGIAEMKESSTLLTLLPKLRQAGNCYSWGGAYNIQRDPAGFGSAFNGAWGEHVFDGDSDLVVPTHSALGFGTPIRVNGCAHTTYFEHHEVLRTLASHGVP